jgi:type IV pilus assembly protein PilQ
MYIMVAGLVVLALSVGCAKKPQQVEDAFFEKWRIMAEQSQGHSPDIQKRKIFFEETALDEPEVYAPEEFEKKKDLPKARVNLELRNANLVSVIKALAKVARVSMVISPNVGGQVDVNIINMPWDRVFTSILKTNGLTYAWEGDILRVITKGDIERDAELEEIEKKRQTTKYEIKRVEPLLTSVIKIKYGNADLFKEDLEKFLTKDEAGEPRGSVEVNEHTNSLIINAVRDDITTMVKLVDKLDQPRSQVKIKAHIVETTQEVARSLGVQWGAQKQFDDLGGDDSFFINPGATNSDFDFEENLLTGDAILTEGWSATGNIFSAPASDVLDLGQGLALGLGFGTIGADFLEAQLTALAQENKVNILSSPSITTLDNQPAVTKNGAEVPFVTLDEAGNAEVQFKEAVISLEMTPHIIDEDYLKLEVLVKKDEVDTTRTVLGNPFIIKRETRTNLIIHDKETVVISGLTEERDAMDERGLPGLKDIPALGWLFKGQDRQAQMEEVLIFITPTILDRWTPGFKQRSLDEIEQDLIQQGIINPTDWQDDFKF